MRGIDRFEGRSSLKTWIFRILVNRARTRGRQEARSIPFSSAFGAEEGDPEPAVDPGRFVAAGPGAGGWREGDQPVGHLLAGEAREKILAAIEALPPAQREVVTLRDVEGWSAPETCNALGLTETNQRVLLHRGRSKVRTALEGYFED